MSDYFVATWTCEVSPAQAKRIRQEVRAIDPGMSFVRHYVTGNWVHGWLVRDNDGTNTHRDVEARNARCVAIANRILGAEGD